MRSPALWAATSWAADRVLAPGPGHSRKDRSLSIIIGSQFPEGFWVTSFAGDDALVCRAYVRAKLGLPAWSAHGHARRPVSRLAQVVDPAVAKESENRIARALAIWNESQDPRGTLAERYLKDERNLALLSDLANAVLRFHPACPWENERVPALIALFRDIHSDEPTGIHRRRLTADGRKAGKPKMLGRAVGSAIKLDSDEMVTHSLVIGEGVETVLSARQFGFKPAWALGSAGAIGAFPVLSGVEAIRLLTEDDTTGNNARAVNACGTRWQEAGRDVKTLASKIGGDLNDALRGRVD